MFYMLSEDWKAKPRNTSTSLAGSREKTDPVQHHALALGIFRQQIALAPDPNRSYGKTKEEFCSCNTRAH